MSGIAGSHDVNPAGNPAIYQSFSQHAGFMD